MTREHAENVGLTELPGSKPDAKWRHQGRPQLVRRQMGLQEFVKKKSNELMGHRRNGKDLDVSVSKLHQVVGVQGQVVVFLPLTLSRK